MPAKRLLAAIPHYLGTGGFYVTEYRRFYEDGIPGYKAKECHRFYDQSSALSIHKPTQSVLGEANLDQANPDEEIKIDSIKHGSVRPDQAHPGEENKIIDPGGS